MSLNTNYDKYDEGIEHIVIYNNKNCDNKKFNHIKNKILFKSNNKNKFEKVKHHSEGFMYIGEWKNDMRKGNGTFYNPNTKDKYEGEFKNGKAEGKGALYYNNGDMYEGEFKQWLKEGKGIYYFNNGDRYEGEFKNDAIEGYGKYFYKDGKIFDGKFKNGNDISGYISYNI